MTPEEKIEQLNFLLNKACELLTILEEHAEGTLRNEVDAFFNEVKYSDELDHEMNICNDQER